MRYWIMPDPGHGQIEDEDDREWIYDTPSYIEFGPPGNKYAAGIELSGELAQWYVTTYWIKLSISDFFVATCLANQYDTPYSMLSGADRGPEALAKYASVGWPVFTRLLINGLQDKPRFKAS